MTVSEPSAVLYTDWATFIQGQFNVSNPKRSINRGGNNYGSESRSNALDESKNWRAATHEAPREARPQLRSQERPYETGSYYLCYTQNRKRVWESVGNDLAVALQEQRARQSALETVEVPAAVEATARRNLREVAAEFFATKPTENWRHILTVFGERWGWTKDPADFQRADFKAFRKYIATLGLRPRTEHNYLNQICTFFRATGRVVVVAATEQDAAGCNPQASNGCGPEHLDFGVLGFPDGKSRYAGLLLR
jgi:hypothetical protein